MRWLIFLLLYSFLCAGCSLPLAQKNEKVVAPEPVPSALFNIRIERWGTQQLSGLLALLDRPTGLSYVLLDATGMKLLEGEISSENNSVNLPSGGILKKSGLAGYFIQSLERVFLYEPSKKPCGRSWLLQFCSEKEKGHTWYKTARFWPFTLWRAEGKSEMIQYSQPWLGVTLYLKNIRQN